MEKQDLAEAAAASLNDTAAQSSSSQSSFWRRHAAKLPGSVKAMVLPNTGMVVGASYAHGTRLDQVIPGGSQAMNEGTSSHPNSRSSSPKPFRKTGKPVTAQPFLKDTADVWSADLDDTDMDGIVLVSSNKANNVVKPQDEIVRSRQASVAAATTENAAPVAAPRPQRAISDSSKPMSGRNTPVPLNMTPQPPVTIAKFSTTYSAPKDATAATLATKAADDVARAEIARINTKVMRMDKFKAVLEAETIDLAALRKLAWNGVPEPFRAMTWQVLLGYLPCNRERRDATLQRKRQEYLDHVQQLFSRGTQGLEHATYHQIHIDMPRTNPDVALFKHECVQQSLERILYCWAIRHPASGYVQGINDLATPFYTVFLAAHIGDEDVELFDPSRLSEQVMQQIEADAFWCLSKLIDGIQDNYTASQPGIQRQIARLRDLVQRIDAPLYAHFQKENVEFLQFSFRWMNCLLMREVTLKATIRLWDTYLAEGDDGFSEFHLYVCAALLVKWTESLRKLEFQDILMFLQSVPTKQWTDQDVELLLSEAFMWKSLFHNAQSHLTSTGTGLLPMSLGPS